MDLRREFMLRKRVTTTLFLILAALLLILAVALIALGWTSEASAAPRQQHERNSTHHELKTFEKFLDDHQSIAADLKRDPSLIGNQDYLAQHPELQQFLETHPGMLQELAAKNDRCAVPIPIIFDRA